MNRVYHEFKSAETTYWIGILLRFKKGRIYFDNGYYVVIKKLFGHFYVVDEGESKINLK